MRNAYSRKGTSSKASTMTPRRATTNGKLDTWLILLLVLLLPATGYGSGTFEVDGGAQLGNIKFLSGVNSGPVTPPGVDLSAEYQDMGVNYIRTHDYYGPCDISQIFPNWDADPADPASYNFGPSDTKVSAIVQGGFTPYFRLGNSWDGPNDPPPDFDKFATVSVNIVRHYNEGWAGGFRFGIRHWEIWNAPDIRRFWTGTPAGFYDMFDRTARALKAHNPNLKVGGPGVTAAHPPQWRTGFLQYSVDHSTPLDFFSWHRYRPGFADFAAQAATIQADLDAYGYSKTESHLTEWNSPDRDHFKDAANAAHTAAFVTLMQDTTITLATKYRGDNHPYGMFELYPPHGRTPPTYAFTALRWMRDTPRRLAVRYLECD